MRFSVHSCDDFAVEAVVGDANVTGFPTPLTYTRDAQGGYVASFVTGDLLTAMNDTYVCDGSAAAPFGTSLRLAVTCKADGRRVESNAIPVRFAVANVAHMAWDIETVDDLGDANHVFAVSRSWIGLLHLEQNNEQLSSVIQQGVLERQYFSIQASAGSAFAHHGETGYLADGCNLKTCGTLQATDPSTGVSVVATKTSLYILDLHDHVVDLALQNTEAQIITDMIAIPGSVNRLIPQDDGSIRILSVAGADLIVSRLMGRTLLTEHVWKNEAIIGGWGAQKSNAVFFTQRGGPDSSKAVLRNINAGAGVAMQLPGDGNALEIAPSADGQRWFMQRNGVLWVGTSTQSWQRVGDDTIYRQVAWTPKGLVAFQSFWEGTVDVLEPVEGIWSVVGHYTVQPTGFARMLTSESGQIIIYDEKTVQILDEHANFLGSVDQANCSQDPSVGHAVALSHNRLALINKNRSARAYFIDLADYLN